MTHARSLAHCCLLGLACAAGWSHAAAPDRTLAGCWRAVKIVLYTQDGGKMEDTSGRCTLQFDEDRLTSACATTSGTATTTYHYKVVRPNVYATTMSGSSFRTDLVGTTREYEYRVEGDRLVTVTTTGAVRAESEAARTPCAPP